MLSTPFDLRQLLTPGGAIPDLEVVVDAGHDDVAAELRVLDQRARNHQPALLVEVRLRRAGEEEPVEPAPLLAERIQRGELRVDESSPIRTTVGVETAVEPARDDDPLGKGLPELGGKGEAVLVIDRVLVLAEKHRLGRLPSFPLRPTLSHEPPQRKPKGGFFVRQPKCGESRRIGQSTSEPTVLRPNRLGSYLSLALGLLFGLAGARMLARR